jgi:hypothetical protein
MHYLKTPMGLSANVQRFQWMGQRFCCVLKCQHSLGQLSKSGVSLGKALVEEESVEPVDRRHLAILQWTDLRWLQAHHQLANHLALHGRLLQT